MDRTRKIVIVFGALLAAVYLSYCIFTNYQKTELAKNPEEISCVDSTVTGGRIFASYGKNDYRTTPNREEIYIQTREATPKYFDITFLYTPTHVRVNLDDHVKPVLACYLKKFPSTIVEAYYDNMALSTDTYDIFDADENFGWNIVLLVLVVIFTPVIVFRKHPIIVDRAAYFKTSASSSKIFRWIAIIFGAVFMFGIIAIVLGSM